MRQLLDTGAASSSPLPPPLPQRPPSPARLADQDADKLKPDTTERTPYSIPMVQADTAPVLAASKLLATNVLFCVLDRSVPPELPLCCLSVATSMGLRLIAAHISAVCAAACCCLLQWRGPQQPRPERLAQHPVWQWQLPQWPKQLPPVGQGPGRARDACCRWAGRARFLAHVPATAAASLSAVALQGCRRQQQPMQMQLLFSPAKAEHSGSSAVTEVPLQIAPTPPLQGPSRPTATLQVFLAWRARARGSI
jgi:hypothetical protein